MDEKTTAFVAYNAALHQTKQVLCTQRPWFAETFRVLGESVCNAPALDAVPAGVAPVDWTLAVCVLRPLVDPRLRASQSNPVDRARLLLEACDHMNSAACHLRDAALRPALVLVAQRLLMDGGGGGSIPCGDGTTFAKNPGYGLFVMRAIAMVRLCATGQVEEAAGMVRPLLTSMFSRIPHLSRAANPVGGAISAKERYDKLHGIPRKRAITNLEAADEAVRAARALREGEEDAAAIRARRGGERPPAARADEVPVSTNPDEASAEPTAAAAAAAAPRSPGEGAIAPAAMIILDEQRVRMLRRVDQCISNPAKRIRLVVERAPGPSPG